MNMVWKLEIVDRECCNTRIHMIYCILHLQIPLNIHEITEFPFQTPTRMGIFHPRNWLKQENYLILTGSDPNLINHVKSSLKKNFKMSDLGHLHYFLGIQVLQTKEGIFFPSLSILVTFFIASTWKIVNQPLLSSSLE